MSAPAVLSVPRPAPARRRGARLRSHLLGDIVVPPQAILEFPSGLFGFAACRQWVLLPAGRPGWNWLHALEHPALAFLLVDPFVRFPGFSVTLAPQDLAALGVEQAADVAVFAIVTLPRQPEGPLTANLQGPVAIALSSRRGRQLAAVDSTFGSRVAFDPGPATLAQVLSGRDDTEA